MTLLPARRSVAASFGGLAVALLGVVWPFFLPYAGLALALGVGAVALDAGRLVRSRPLDVARLLPSRAVAGRPVELRYHIENPNAFPVRAELLDELPDDLGGDLRLGPVSVDGGGQVELRSRVTPSRRGERPLGPVYWLHRSPAGWLYRRGAARPAPSLAVLPASAARSHRSGVQERSVLDEFGIRPRRPRGEGLEFESLREYVRGDDPRHIDWPATARSGRTTVRQYQIERNHRILIAVDTGRLMAGKIDGTTKLDWALAAAVALARAAHASDDSVGLVAFDAEVRGWTPPIDSRRSLGPLLEGTLPLEPSSRVTSYRALATLLQSQQRKRALLVVLTDFVEGASALELQRYLGVLAKRHALLLVALRDRLLRSLESAAPEVHGPELYERLVLQDLEVERQTALAQIRRLGVHALDLDPARATAPILSAHLRIREAGLI